MTNNKFKILLIEDELNIHSFMQTILEAEGYQVLRATTGAQGKLIFRSHLPDLILLDLGLPDMDGTELIREIRSYSVTPIFPIAALKPHDATTSKAMMTAENFISVFSAKVFSGNAYFTKRRVLH